LVLTVLQQPGCVVVINGLVEHAPGDDLLDPRAAGAKPLFEFTLLHLSPEFLVSLIGKVELGEFLSDRAAFGLRDLFLGLEGESDGQGCQDQPRRRTCDHRHSLSSW
jgi:hypothetical protein